MATTSNPSSSNGPGSMPSTEEKHDAANCPVPAGRLLSARGIEVGQIFFLGTKYSKPMNAVVAGPNGEQIVPEMGCYGIGVSRLVAAIIEASHDDAGIIWPESVAPFQAGLDQSARRRCRLHRRGRRALPDLSATPASTRSMTTARNRPAPNSRRWILIGLPWQIVIGPRGLQKGVVEVKNRRTGQREEMTAEAALNRLRAAS